MAEVTQADINAAADILDAIAAEVGHEQQSNVAELRALLLAIRHRTEAVKPLVEALELLAWLTECDNLILAASSTDDSWEVRRGSGMLRGKGKTPLEALRNARDAALRSVQS